MKMRGIMAREMRERPMMRRFGPDDAEEEDASASPVGRIYWLWSIIGGAEDLSMTMELGEGDVSMRMEVGDELVADDWTS